LYKHQKKHPSREKDVTKPNDNCGSTRKSTQVGPKDVTKPINNSGRMAKIAVNIHHSCCDVKVAQNILTLWQGAWAKRGDLKASTRSLEHHVGHYLIRPFLDIWTKGMEIETSKFMLSDRNIDASREGAGF
jgi:hypothetical protein